jgi:uncharacterized membrane protein
MWADAGRAGRVRAELQRGASPSLRRRRRIALLSSLALADAALVALRQMGAVRHLPDLPGRAFDSDAVTGSAAAYVLGAPDAAVACGAFALNLVAASAGGSRRSGRRPRWSWLLLAAVAAESAGAVAYLGDMIFREKRACPYCLVSMALTWAMLPLAAAEALRPG